MLVGTSKRTNVRCEKEGCVVTSGDPLLVKKGNVVHVESKVIGLNSVP